MGQNKSDWKRRLVAFFLYCFGISQVQIKNERKRLGNNYVRIANYHNITENEVPSFLKQLRFIRRYFDFISFDQFDLFAKGQLRLEKPGFLLTFDDGLSGCYHPLLEVLKQENIPAVYCVCPDKIGTEGYMSHDEVQEAIDSELVTIVSHTCSHRPMWDGLPQSEYAYEVIESKKRLEAEFCVPVSAFCWPFGGNDCYATDAFRAYLAARYIYGFCTFSSPFLPTSSPHIVPRTNLQLYWTLAEVAFQLSPSHDKRLAKKKSICEAHFKEATATN